MRERSGLQLALRRLPSRQAVQQPSEPFVVAPPDEVREFVHDDVLDGVDGPSLHRSLRGMRPLGPRTREPGSPGADSALFVANGLFDERALLGCLRAFGPARCSESREGVGRVHPQRAKEAACNESRTTEAPVAVDDDDRRLPFEEPANELVGVGSGGNRHVTYWSVNDVETTCTSEDNQLGDAKCLHRWIASSQASAADEG